MNPLKHVAIIMDGNGRWGLKNKNSRNAGHHRPMRAFVPLESTFRNWNTGTESCELASASTQE